MASPVVSVVMSVCDGEQYLPYLSASIESVLRQTFSNFEAVIVTDESTDPEAIRIIDSFSDKRIRHINVRGQHNGYVRLLNIGLTNSKGRYFARFDADDISLPQRFENQIRFLEEHPDVGVIGSGYEIIDEKGIVRQRPRPTLGTAMIEWKLLFCDNPIAHPSIMGRREIFDQLDGYNPNIMYSEDYELWVRTLKLCRIENVPDTLLLFRKHQTSVSHSHALAQLQNTLSIARRALSSTFQEDVPPAYLDVIVKHQINDPSEAYEAASWMFEKCMDYSKRPGLSPSEIKSIRAYTAAKLYPLALICAKKSVLQSPRLWQLILVLDKTQFIRFWLDSVRRAINYPIKRLGRI